MAKESYKKFLDNANTKFKSKFTYSDNYVNRDMPITVTCPKHGASQQTPKAHLISKHGCKECYLDSVKMSLQEMKDKLNLIHNNLYDYSLITSVENIRTEPLKIICKEHGVFEQMYVNHYQKCGCQTCASEKQMINKEQYFEKVKILHNNFYDYSKAVFVDNYTPMEIICPNHGSFWQEPRVHSSGSGCKDCVHDSLRMTWSEFLDRANQKHNCFYNYPEHFDLNRNTDKIPIICPKHGIFPQTASGHLSGHGCPHCVNKISKPEMQVQEFLKTLGYEIEMNKRKYIKPYELDIYIPELNKAIEFNGRYWHYSDKHFVPGKHANKSNLCRQKGIKLLHIREELWIKDQSKMKEVIMKFLEHK